MHDKARIRRAFSTAAHSYDQVAQLQREVGGQLLQRIDAAGAAGRVLDLGCGTGFLTGGLAGQAGVHSVVALDLAPAMLHKARHKLGNPRHLHYVCADAENLPLADASMDWVVSNLALQWCQGLDRVCADIRRVLKPGGQLAFSTFGEGTLQELDTAWAEVDSHRHVNTFLDERQLRQLLRQAGFAGIQTQCSGYTPSYDSVMGLLTELKQLGARTVVADRCRHLTGKQKMQAMMAAYQRLHGTPITASFHVITLTAQR